MNNTRAQLIFRRRIELAESRFADLVIWRLAWPVAGSRHPFKYRLAYVVNDICVLRYDNEAGKGDHRHLGQQETPYHFVSVQQLQEDFIHDIRRWNHEHGGL